MIVWGSGGRLVGVEWRFPEFFGAVRQQIGLCLVVLPS